MKIPPAETCAIAFKEWSGVCDALLEGRQSIIVRKGGISEAAGAGSFAPEHPAFWLYPTWSHQMVQGLRTGEKTAAAPGSGDSVPIRALARVELAGMAENEQALDALEEFHVFTQETMLKRFHYRRPGLWVLCARVWRRERAVNVAVTPEQAGCKTWVILPEPLSTAGLLPVFDDKDWAAIRRRLEPALAWHPMGPSGPASAKEV
jgi:hypothetical protein